jgi:hypothetical protein
MSLQAQASASTPDPHAVDREALLAALVLAPATFARNKFFTLFTEPSAQKARGRATQLRTIVGHLTEDAQGRATLIALEPEGERTVLRYDVPALHLVRTARLESLELALLRFALWRRAQGEARQGALAPALRVTDDDRAAVVAALRKLSRELQMGDP